MPRHPNLEAFDPLVIAQSGELFIVKFLNEVLSDGSDSLALGSAGQTDPIANHLAYRIITSGSTEDERDGRQHVAVLEQFDEVGPTG
jgi:hypothetical protein